MTQDASSKLFYCFFSLNSRMHITRMISLCCVFIFAMKPVTHSISGSPFLSSLIVIWGPREKNIPYLTLTTQSRETFVIFFCFAPYIFRSFLGMRFVHRIIKEFSGAFAVAEERLIIVHGDHHHSFLIVTEATRKEGTKTRRKAEKTSLVIQSSPEPCLFSSDISQPVSQSILIACTVHKKIDKTIFFFYISTHNLEWKMMMLFFSWMELVSHFNIFFFFCFLVFKTFP